ncbi:MAG: AI-2E family transporter [Elusimicrobia bacterium]|nr:AI-2E family transporter [Elusimicrobiota bacterium]
MAKPSHRPRIIEIERKQLFRYFFFGVFALLLYQLLQIISPFVTALMWSATLTLIFYPIHERMTRRVGQRHTAAFLSTTIVALAVIVPLLFFLWFLVRESAQLYPAARAWVGTLKNLDMHSAESILPRPILSIWNGVQTILTSFGIDLQDIFLKNLNEIGQAITRLGGVIAKNLLFLIVNLLLLMISLFFFFKDGATLIRWILDLTPMEHDHKHRIATQLYETLTAVVRGATLTAASQGLLAGIGFAIAGVPFPVFLGAVTAFAALIPPTGATLVWLPIALYRLAHSTGEGVFLSIWGILVISGIDNILRPILIGSKVKLPFLLLFFGIMGGMRVYGFLGLILGPMLIACTLAFIQIYRQEYHQTTGTRGEG